MRTSSRRRLLGPALAISLVFARAPAFAASPAELEEAKKLFVEGNKLRDDGDLAGALDRFEKANALAHTPITQLEVGKANLALGRLASAYRAFVAVAAIAVDSKESPNTKSARADADVLARDVEPHVPRVTTKVENAAAESVKIVIDDAPIDGAPPYLVDPGAHTLRATTGAQTITLAFEAKKDGTIELPVHFEPPPPSADATPAASNPTPSPLAPAPMPVDRPTPSPRYSAPLVYGGFGVAAVGLVAGTITGVMTLSKASSLKGACPDGRCPPDAHDDHASTSRLGTISTLSFAIAGAGAAVGIVGLFVHPSDGDHTVAHVAPWVGLGAVGAEGSF